MKRRPSGSLSLSKDVVGFINHKLAEGRTIRSVASYERLLHKWIKQTQDKYLDQVTPADIKAYLAWLRTDYQPVRLNGQTHPLSPKIICNVWVTLASVFRWASEEFDIPDPLETIPAPKFKPAPVNAFTRVEVERMLKACDITREADTRWRRSYTFPRPTAKRDKAILLTLLATDLRAMELCSLKIGDVNLKTGRVEVKHGFQGVQKVEKGERSSWGKPLAERGGGI